MSWDKMLLSGVATVICTFIHILCYKKISNKNIIFSKNNILWLVLTSILLLLVNFYAELSLTAIISFLLTLSTYILIFKDGFFKTIYYAFVIWIFGMIFDILVSCVIMAFGVKDLQYFLNNLLLLKLAISLIIPAIIYFLFSIKKLALFINNIYVKIKSQKISFNTILFILLIVVINILAVINTFVVTTKLLKYSIIIVLIIFCIMTYTIILLNYRKNSIKLENLRLSENNDNYAIISKEYRVMRHNLVNKLKGIESVANKKAILLIEDLIKQYKKENDFISVIDNVPSGINGIIYQKMYPYADENIDFVINNNISEKQFHRLSPKRYNLLCESIGIVLDNSLEAILECKRKILFINIQEIDKKLKIEVINSFNNNIDIDSLGTENYSTKQRVGGIGLSYLIKNKQLKFKTYIINTNFGVEFWI